MEASELGGRIIDPDLAELYTRIAARIRISKALLQSSRRLLQKATTREIAAVPRSTGLSD